MTRLVKRYSNRKLYDTTESRYVTLDEIARWVKAGEDVKIVENESGQDLTAVTFAQIILEEERKKTGLLSLRMMRDLIQHGESALQGLAATVESGLEAIRTAPERAGRRVQEELTQVNERLNEAQKALDDMIRKSVELFTENPRFKREVQRAEKTARMLQARIARLRGQEPPADAAAADAAVPPPPPDAAVPPPPPTGTDHH